MPYFRKSVSAPDPRRRRARSRARLTAGAAIVLLEGAIAGGASAAQYHTVSRCGAWETVVAELDGRPVTGAVTHPCWGCRAAVLIADDGVSLRLSGPRNIAPGVLARLWVFVDGIPYRGRAAAVNDRDFEMPLSPDLLAAIADGQTAVIAIERTRWTLDLYGLAVSLRQAAAYRFPFSADE